MRIIGGLLALIGGLIAGYGWWMYQAFHRMMLSAGVFHSTRNRLPHPEAAVYYLIDAIFRAGASNPAQIARWADWIIIAIMVTGGLLCVGGIAGMLKHRNKDPQQA